MKRILYCSMALLTAGLAAALAVFYGHRGRGGAERGDYAGHHPLPRGHAAAGRLCIDSRYHNRMAGTGRWFQEKPFERRLYHLLRVHRWKGWLPTWEKRFLICGSGRRQS